MLSVIGRLGPQPRSATDSGMLLRQCIDRSAVPGLSPPPFARQAAGTPLAGRLSGFSRHYPVLVGLAKQP
jgi:hypothetical protein